MKQPTCYIKATLLLTCLFLAGGMHPALAAGKLTVIATTTELASIAEAVGGENVDVTALATGKEDTHFIQARPSYMVKAQRANLWIRNGLELEIGYEPLILRGSRNNDIQVGQPGHLDASIHIVPLDVPTAPVDRSLGDVHPEGNPHYHLDPYNGRVIAQTICERLIQIDPVDAGDYTANTVAFLQHLDAAMFGQALVDRVGGDALWKAMNEGTLSALLAKPNMPSLGGWAAKMAPLQGTILVTYHRGWVYFAHRFGLIEIGEVESKPGIPPSPNHLAELSARMKAQNARLILMAPYFSDKAPKFLAKQTGAKIVVAANSVHGQKEAGNYIALMDNVVNRIASALSE